MLEVGKNLPSWFLASVLLLVLALVCYLLITGTSIRYGDGVLGFISPAKIENSQDTTHKEALPRDITLGINLTKLQQENKTIASEKEKLETELEMSRDKIAEMGLALEKAKEEIKRLEDELTRTRPSQKITDIHLEVKKEVVTRLKESAVELGEEADRGLKWRNDTTGETAANSLVGEYNYLVQRAKKLFSTVRTIQLLEEASQEQVPNVAAGKIKRLANNMERILASM